FAAGGHDDLSITFVVVLDHSEYRRPYRGTSSRLKSRSQTRSNPQPQPDLMVLTTRYVIDRIYLRSRCFVDIHKGRFVHRFSFRLAQVSGFRSADHVCTWLVRRCLPWLLFSERRYRSERPCSRRLCSGCVVIRRLPRRRLLEVLLIQISVM